MIPVQHLLSQEIWKTEGTDCEAVNKITDFLRNKGYVVFNTKNPKEVFDLYVIAPDGIDYLVECKGQSFPSTKYPDHICEQNKLVNVQKYTTLDRCFLITLYTDNVLKISNYTWENYVEKNRANKTTDFGPSKKVDKIFVHFTKPVIKHL